MAVTVADIISKARFRTDQDAGFSQVDSADLIPAASDAYARLWALVARADPDSLSEAATFTVASGDSKDLLTVATDFFLLTGLEVLWGSRYVKLERFNWAERENFAPAADVTGSYRMWYVPAALTLTTTTGATGTLDPLVALNGWDEYVVEQLCALIRTRLDDDPAPHLARAGKIEDELKALAAVRDSSEPATVIDVWTEPYRGTPALDRSYHLRGSTIHLRAGQWR